MPGTHPTRRPYRRVSVEPYRLDARRCISYMTIELREPIPAEERGSNRAADIWLRHLPGRLSLQPPCADDGRTGLSTAARHEPDRPGRAVAIGRGGFSRAVSRHAAIAGEAARADLPGGLSAPAIGPIPCAARLDRGSARRRSGGARGMCLGTVVRTIPRVTISHATKPISSAAIAPDIYSYLPD